jgi:excisionase family DNA binding protein
MANISHAQTRRETLENLAPTTQPFALLNTDQAAAALAMGRRTLQEKVQAREIGFVKIGKSIRFRPQDIADFIERNRVKAAGWKGQAR